MELTPGTTVDRYTIECALGEGGMAIVYKVRHRSLGSLHALKVLSLKMPSVRERLVQEGRVQASLRHPNIVAVTDIIEVDGAPGLIMEFIDGPDLESLLERYRPTLEEAEALAVGIISGVASAHRLGLIHRDLKPANVLMASTDAGPVPKVADFGLAKLLSGDAAAVMSRTRSGQAMGTPSYMAPEQIRNAKGVDKRADVFSLGAILYDLVCGRQAFAGGDLLTVFSAITTGSYTPPDEVVPGLPERMVNAINGALRVNPEERIPDCETLLATWTGVATRTGVVPIKRSEASWSPALMSSLSMAGGGADAAPTVYVSQRKVSTQTYNPESILGEDLRDDEPTGARSPSIFQLAPDAVGTTQVPRTSIGPSVAPPSASKRPWPLAAGGLGALGIAAVAAATFGAFEGRPAAPAQEAAAIAPTEAAPATGTAPSAQGLASSAPLTDPPLASVAPSPSVVPSLSAPPVAPTQPTAVKKAVALAPTSAPAAAAAVKASTAATPAAAAETPPAAQAAPAADPTTALVTVKGDAKRVWLESAAGRFPAGEVAPGTYRITAFFDGVDPVVTGEITVKAGDHRELRCSGQLMVCR